MQQEAERYLRQAKVDALYVNPFILAADQWQSRFFNLLRQGGIKVINEHYSNDEDGAADTIFLISQYFAWERIIYRYGPYAHDPVVINATQAIRESFANSSTGCGAFCFFRTEQEALGLFVTRRGLGENGSEFGIENPFDFARGIEKPDGPLSASKSVKITMNAVKKADRPESLDGRERITKIQRQLVDLLDYIEAKEGFSVFVGKRRKA